MCMYRGVARTVRAVRTSNIIVARGSNSLPWMSLFNGLAPNWGLNPLLANQSSASGVMVTLTSVRAVSEIEG